MRDAFLRLGARPLLGLGDVHRGGDKHLAFAVPGGFVSVVIGLDMRLELEPGRMPRAGEDGIAERADCGKGVRRAGGGTDVRQWLLIGSWDTGDVVKAGKFAGIGKTRVGLSPPDDVADV